MKGVLLAGGTGSRLRPLTAVTNKHLLPVYDRPMLFWPLDVFRANRIGEVLVVTGREHAGSVFALLGSGEDLGFEFTFRVQDEPGGIAQALALAEGFVGWDPSDRGPDQFQFLAVLADNVFIPPPAVRPLTYPDYPDDLVGGRARVWLKLVDAPERYGVPAFEGPARERITAIVEKPAKPPSLYAVTGCYLYDATVFGVITGLEPSARGELEITDVNNVYAARGDLEWEALSGYWGDCGSSLEGLLEASEAVRRESIGARLGPRSA